MGVCRLTEKGHEELADSAALYALGALAAPERRDFEIHLRSCDVCAAEVRELTHVVDRLAFAAPAVDPPPALRSRVFASLARPDDQTPVQSASQTAWLAAAAMLALCVGLGIYAVSLRDRVQRLEREVADALRSADAARVRLAVLTSPDLADVPLAGQPPAPSARGRALWSRSRGLVLAASELPPAPPGRTYQVWYLTGGAPVSAGLVLPDAQGTAIGYFETPQLPAAPTGFALSLEPEGGVPSPTGPIYLAGEQQ